MIETSWNRRTVPAFRVPGGGSSRGGSSTTARSCTYTGRRSIGARRFERAFRDPGSKGSLPEGALRLERDERDTSPCLLRRVKTAFGQSRLDTAKRSHNRSGWTGPKMECSSSFDRSACR